MDPINKKKNFGFLGLTLGIFDSGCFYDLKLLNIGILKIDGITFNDCIKQMTNSYSNVLQINDTAIFFSMFIESTEYLERRNFSRKKSFLRNKSVSPKKILNTPLLDGGIGVGK